MAESDDQDESQKTEEPTQKRMDDALKKGQVISSKEINHFFILLVVTLILISLSPYLSNKVVNILKPLIANSYQIQINIGNLSSLANKLLSQLFAIMIVPFIFIMFAALAASFVQNGRFIFTFEPIIPKLEKISLLKGLKRLFSFKSLFEFLKGIVKMVLIAVAIYLAISSKLPVVKNIYDYEPSAIMSTFLALLSKVFIAACIIMAFVALFDYLYQRFEYYKNMRMSKKDIKEENKQLEGSPEIKAKLKKIRSERARQRMMSSVPKADVVITNPTHYSIALIYDSNTMRAPIVCAKGVDSLALKIREVAKENEITLVENPPLAQGLYSTAEIDEEIPMEYYQAVAEIISYVYKLKNKSV